MSGPHVDPGWRGGHSDSWQEGSADSRRGPDPGWGAPLDPNEFVKKRREPLQTLRGREGPGGDAAQTAMLVALQTVKMSFVAAWKMFTFIIRVIVR
jgi:hypothetical protein